MAFRYPNLSALIAFGLSTEKNCVNRFLIITSKLLTQPKYHYFPRYVKSGRVGSGRELGTKKRPRVAGPFSVVVGTRGQTTQGGMACSVTCDLELCQSWCSYWKAAGDHPNFLRNHSGAGRPASVQDFTLQSGYYLLRDEARWNDLDQ